MNEAYIVIIDEHGKSDEAFLRLHDLKSEILDRSISEI
jgi:hypothetical protein